MTEDTSTDGGGLGGPDEALYVRGVDYVSPWRDADAVAAEMNAALEALGVDTRAIRAVPHVGARGEPVVWLRLEGARVVARALRGASAPVAGLAVLQRIVDEDEGELRHGAA
jgi:hypothetical protein